MLARVGELQGSRIFSWDKHRRSDPCSSGRLRLQPFSAVRRSFSDDCSDRSRYRRFVSLLVCTFSWRPAAIAVAANSSNEVCYHPARLNRLRAQLAGKSRYRKLESTYAIGALMRHSAHKLDIQLPRLSLSPVLE